MHGLGWVTITFVCLGGLAFGAEAPKAGDAALGSQPYDRFESDETCGECHVDIARQHAQALMSQSFVHPWDEIEYFGDRIFRMPYLDPKGRMTVAQWNTASFGPDYRLAPLRSVTETYSWTLPADTAKGRAAVTARVWYSRLVSSVAEHMKVPAEEITAVPVAEHVIALSVR